MPYGASVVRLARAVAIVALAATAATAAACGGPGGADAAADDGRVEALPAGPAAPARIGTTTTATTTSPTTTAAPAPTATPDVVPDPRLPRVQPWEPFAEVGGLVLRHPSAWVERIGFHESNHDGAQPMTPLPTAVAPTVLETRDRDTVATGAADMVVQPGTEIRAPVTGRVLRASPYTLYCAHRDEYLVIEPDAHPGWEVKVLHVVGLLVGKGDRVEAGVTPVARHAHQLPFESQVDELRAADPAWPHVHVEVVDPSVPDRPSPGGGC